MFKALEISVAEVRRCRASISALPTSDRFTLHLDEADQILKLILDGEYKRAFGRAHCWEFKCTGRLAELLPLFTLLCKLAIKFENEMKED
jgi:hypothetical protein